MQENQTGLYRTIAGGAVGNVMEWFDFAAYAYMAPIIGALFFPAEDHFSSLIAAYGAFAAGYVARPLGAVLFGHIGDRMGRKPLLLLSITMMGLATAGIGLLPTHAAICGAAGLALVALRLLQGISVGGEYAGSLVFVAEHAPKRRRGFFCCLILSGSSLGFLMGSALVTGMSAVIPQESLHDWAWRVPFLAGGLLAIAILLLRRDLPEPPREEHTDELPVKVVLRDHWRDVLRVGGLYMGVNAGFYMIFVYTVSYLTDEIHVDPSAVMDINTFCLVIISFLPLFFAVLSDRIGRRLILVTGTLGIIALSYPLFVLMSHPDTTLVLLGQMGFVLLFSWIWGANPAAQVESAPPKVRASVLTISTNVAMAVFGGTTPLVATYLVHRTGDDFMPAFYMMFLASLTLIAVLSTPETRGRNLT